MRRVFSMIQLLGWIGLLGIAVAWIPQTYHVIVTQRTTIPLSFTIVYIIGSLLLVIYSWLLQDPVFIVLNLLATLSACVHLTVTLRCRR